MVVVSTRIDKNTREKLLEMCIAIYGKNKVGPCLKELIRDALLAYYRIRPTRETLQRTILDLLKTKR